jgi:hypothetical protein
LAIGVVILSVRKAPLRVVKSAVKRSIKLMPGPVLALAASRRSRRAEHRAAPWRWQGASRCGGRYPPPQIKLREWPRCEL